MRLYGKLLEKLLFERDFAANTTGVCKNKCRGDTNSGRRMLSILPARSSAGQTLAITQEILPMDVMR